jgi:hypothetical protein
MDMEEREGKGVDDWKERNDGRKGSLEGGS